MKRRILITGSGGQLGRSLEARLSTDWDVDAKPHAELDIRDPVALRQACRVVRPHYVINCAAWTRVDEAESNREAALRLNDTAVGHVADAAVEVGACVVHYSTDYVFNGRSERPYVEEDAPDPLSVYGASKLAGERRLLAHPVDSLILRTSWLYSDVGRNFYLTMRRLGPEAIASGKPLGVVDDQIGTPTDAPGLAEQTERLLRADVRGLVHASSKGAATWFQFAQAIFELCDLEVPLQAISTAEYGSAARRPAYSLLENRKLKSLGLSTLSHWKDGLRRVLAVHREKLARI